MNIAKIHADFITRIINKKPNDDCSYGMWTKEGKICLCPDNHTMYLINEDDFMIDLDKWGKAPSFNPDKFINLEIDTEPAVLTNEMQYIPKFKVTLVKVENCHLHAWVDQKSLKCFDKDCSFRIISRTAPIFIYEDNRLVGIVLPVNVKGDC